MTLYLPFSSSNHENIMNQRLKTYQKQCFSYFRHLEHLDPELSARGRPLHRYKKIYKGKISLNPDDFLEAPLDHVYSVHEAVHDPPKAHITICTTPKSGTTNWRYMMHAIQSNKTIEETSEMSRWGGNGLYKLLYPWRNFIHSIPIYKRWGQESLKNWWKSTYAFPDEIESGQNEELQEVDLRNVMFDELNKSNIKKSVKIMTVRHPLARLQSCWRDKFSYWYTDDGKTIKHDQILWQMWSPLWRFINEFIETPRTNLTKGRGNHVSLEGFLKYVV